jgi:hypothetical protein
MSARRNLAIAIFALLGLAIPTIAQPSPKCNNRMTKGTYGFACTGVVIPGPGSAPIPFAQVGVVISDGTGHWEGPATTSFGGTILPGYVTTTGNPASPIPAADAVINPDCSGTITYLQYAANPDVDPGKAGSPMPLPINFVVVNDGNEIDGLPMGPGSVMTCRLIRTRKLD